ncbi:hypothetical protein COU54_02465 [Candidatus Pacearchaeota archaeon CG10_big_fil_rev_8_21_14_0_10_31_24]|nr:MAG: hypothetical protein COU54_02465 [Candidatus Pacearchaeota archaeon CG10_big_fil_rev_8_21_14_0_10_31_24]
MKYNNKPSFRGEKSFKTLELKIDQIDIAEHDGNSVTISGIVDSIAQTTGPTLFSVVDGSGTLVLKGFDGPGVRAYPNINEGDAIKAVVKIKEFQDSIEGEIRTIQQLDKSASEKLKEDIAKNERERAKVKSIPFLVEDPILVKLKDKFIEAATEVKLAIIKNRPIIIRHHNDCDGYSAGYSLERAIIPLIVKQHGGGKSPWEYYTRAPCQAPFYEIEDSIKDTANSLSAVAKFSNKMPLILIVDNGSSPEDLMAIKQGKIHGADFIVVDHHYFDEDVISKEVLTHINPFLVGEDGKRYSAGMLCTELARFINPVENIDHIPALSGLADRIDNEKSINEYIKIAEKRGYTKPLLQDIATLIDFVSAKLRFMQAREYIEVVFGNPVDRQKELVSLMAPHVRKLEAKGLEIAKSAAKTEKIKDITIQLLFVEETFPRGSYPKPGRSTGMLHDFLIKEKNLVKVVSIGVLADLITIRATEESKFSVHELIAFLKKKVPQAFIEGGGHHLAGAIKFVPSQRQNVLDNTRKYIDSLK